MARSTMRRLLGADTSTALYIVCHMHGASLRSEPFLFQVVHIKPVVHHAIAREGGGDVVLHHFLQFRGQIAQALVP